MGESQQNRRIFGRGVSNIEGSEWSTLLSEMSGWQIQEEVMVVASFDRHRNDQI